MIKSETRMMQFQIFAAIIILYVYNIFPQEVKFNTLVNPSHLDYLYQEINVAGTEMGIIHIYADYPDYKYVDAHDEGIACVDDAARAAIFYVKYYEKNHDSKALDKIKKLTNFLLYMQAENGFFNNFIWKDYTKDTAYKTSVSEPNWWSWRAIWALAEINNFFKKYDKGYSAKILPHLKKAVNVTNEWLDKNNNDSTSFYGGYKLPKWLPFDNAADQAAVIVKGFCAYYESIRDTSVGNQIIHLCNGIMMMQAGNENEFPFYAFLSWQNTWHAWGNSQADALLEAGRLLKRPQFIESAEKEIKYYYPYLIKNSFMNTFTVEKLNNYPVIKDSLKYSQIAYGIRPAVFASLRANDIKRDKKFVSIAASIAEWLFGKNIMNKPMYDPNSGICYDGINSVDEINKNSGAESTIEALLALITIEQNREAKKIVWDYYKNRLDDFSK